MIRRNVVWETCLAQCPLLREFSILHNARDLMRLLRENSDKPKVIWSTLQRRVAAVQASALGDNGMQCDDAEPMASKMPESSSPMAWKILAEEGWHSGKVHLKLN